MYMVRAFNGSPIRICENVSEAFTESVAASASGAVGTGVSVVAIEKNDRERVVGTFQRVNDDEIYCVTPMFPTGTVMLVNRADNGVPVRRFGGMPVAGTPVATTERQVQRQRAAADLRSLLTLAHSGAIAD